MTAAELLSTSANRYLSKICDSSAEILCCRNCRAADRVHSPFCHLLGTPRRELHLVGHYRCIASNCTYNYRVHRLSTVLRIIWRIYIKMDLFQDYDSLCDPRGRASFPLGRPHPVRYPVRYFNYDNSLLAL